MTNTCNDCGVELRAGLFAKDALPDRSLHQTEEKSCITHTPERCLKRQLEQLRTSLGDREHMLETLSAENERLQEIMGDLLLVAIKHLNFCVCKGTTEYSRAKIHDAVLDAQTAMGQQTLDKAIHKAKQALEGKS